MVLNFFIFSFFYKFWHHFPCSAMIWKIYVSVPTWNLKLVLQTVSGEQEMFFLNYFLCFSLIFWHELPFEIIHKIFSIKYWKMLKRPGLFPCIAHVHLLGSGFGLHFLNILVLSASLISLVLVFAFKIFWFECCWWEVAPLNIDIQQAANWKFCLY